MKQVILAFALLIIGPALFSQNYYVAIVKGEVLYEGKPVKKRDKITPSGELQFSTKEDFLKLSGPGGLYTLKPGMDPSSGNEFLIALRKEFFPEVRFRPTVAQNMVFVEGGYYFFSPSPSYTYFETTPIGKISSDPAVQAIGYVHETAKGLVYRKCFVKDSTLTLRRKDFKLGSRKFGSPHITESAIVHIFAEDDFDTILGSCKTLAELMNALPIYSSLNRTPDQAVIDNEGNVTIVQSYPAMIMDRIGPSRFIKRKEIIKDLRFHIQLSKPETRSEFLDDFAYEYYVWEVYGEVHPPSMESVWEELGLEWEE